MKLKKGLTASVLTVILALVNAGLPVLAADTEISVESAEIETEQTESDDEENHTDDIIYGCFYFNENTQMITGYYDDGNANTNIVIPSEINGVPVLGIGEGAFFREGYFETVVIEEGIQTIEAEAFKYCDINTIYIPSTVTEIKYKAFYSEGMVSKVYFAENSNLTTIGEFAFAYCDLQSIRIPASVTTVGRCAFHSCESLSECIFEGDAPENIDSSAFSGYLEDILTIYYYEGKTGFTTPYWLGFYKCEMISTSDYRLIVDESTGKITGYEDNVEAVYSDGILQNPVDLIIPTNINGVEITGIDSDAFAEWERLGNVTMENGIEYVGRYAFEKCVNLKSAFIPNSVIEIGAHAFQDSTSFETVTFEENSKLKCIDEYAFSNTGISEIIIPETVTNIYGDAFRNCVNLKKVYFEGDAPNNLEEDGSAFASCNPDLVLYFYEGKTGYTTPTWLYIKCVMISTGTEPDVWNFSDPALNSLGTITSNVTFGDVTILANSANTVQVKENKKTLNGVTYNYCLSLRGKGNKDYRAVKLDVTRNCTISIAAASNNDSRSLKVVNEDGIVLGTISVGKELSIGSVEYTGRADSLYIYSEKDNVNIYSINVSYN